MSNGARKNCKNGIRKGRNVPLHVAVTAEQNKQIREIAAKYNTTPSNVQYVMLQLATNDFTNFVSVEQVISEQKE